MQSILVLASKDKQNKRLPVIFVNEFCSQICLLKRFSYIQNMKKNLEKIIVNKLYLQVLVINSLESFFLLWHILLQQHQICLGLKIVFQLQYFVQSTAYSFNIYQLGTGSYMFKHGIIYFPVSELNGDETIHRING